MTERDTIRLLRAIKDLALLGYPYHEDTAPIDNGLLLCLGQSAASQARHWPSMSRG